MDISQITADTTVAATPPGEGVAPPVAAPAPQPEKPKNEDVYSRQFLALRNKEKQFRAREQQFSEIEKRYRDFESLKREAPLNPEAAEKALALLGLDYESLTELIAKGKAPDAIKERQMLAEVQKLRDEIAEKEKKSEEAQRQQKLEGYKADIAETLKANAEKFPLINALEHFGAIVDHQLAHLEKGEELGWDEVAEKHEKYLEQEIIKAAQHPAIKKKIQAIYTEKAPDPTKPEIPDNAAPTMSPTEDDLSLAIKMLSGS